MPVLKLLESNGATCAVNGLLPPNSTPWMAAVGPFNPCGAKNSRNMSPKIHPVKYGSVNGGPLPDFND
jgi:hypothetical protein